MSSIRRRKDAGWEPNTVRSSERDTFMEKRAAWRDCAVGHGRGMGPNYRSEQKTDPLI